MTHDDMLHVLSNTVQQQQFNNHFSIEIKTAATDNFQAVTRCVTQAQGCAVY